MGKYDDLLAAAPPPAASPTPAGKYADLLAIAPAPPPPAQPQEQAWPPPAEPGAGPANWIANLAGSFAGGLAAQAPEPLPATAVQPGGIATDQGRDLLSTSAASTFGVGNLGAVSETPAADALMMKRAEDARAAAAQETAPLQDPVAALDQAQAARAGAEMTPAPPAPPIEEIKPTPDDMFTRMAAVSRHVDSLFAPGSAHQTQVISPEVARVGTRLITAPARLVANVLGGDYPKVVQGIEDSITNNVSSFATLESLGSLPAFTAPGMAEAFAIGTVAKLPEQYGRIKEAIQQHGVFSSEAAQAATDAGITDLMGFLAAKSSPHVRAEFRKAFESTRLTDPAALQMRQFLRQGDTDLKTATARVSPEFRTLPEEPVPPPPPEAPPLPKAKEPADVLTPAPETPAKAIAPVAPDVITLANKDQAAAHLGLVNAAAYPDVGVISAADPTHGGNISIPIGATIEEAQQLKDLTAQAFAAPNIEVARAAEDQRSALMAQIKARLGVPEPAPETAPAAAAPPAPDQPETVAQAGFAFQAPTDQIAVKPDLMQYKARDNEATGTNEADRIKDKYDPLLAGNLLLWEPNDPQSYGLSPGQRFIVANGHHRFERAVQDGIKLQNAQVIREADGYSAGDARALAAEYNIRDGKGTIFDATNYLREQAQAAGPDEALASARRIGEKGRKAATIAFNAAPDLYAAFINEKISPDATAAIAEVAPNNNGLQRVGLQKALEGANPKDVANFLAASQANPNLGSTPTAEQVDLFGNNDAALQAADAQGRRASALQKEISEQINAVRGAARRPEKAAALGVDVKDPAGIQKKITELAELQRRTGPTNWFGDPEIRRMIMDTDLSPAQMIEELTKPEKARPAEEGAPRRKFVNAEQFTFGDVEAQAFNLIGEEAIDWDARQREHEYNQEKARIEREKFDQAQTDLFPEPEQPKPGEEVQDLAEEARPATPAPGTSGGRAGVAGGEPPRIVEPADDPRFSALKLDLPELYRFGRDLLNAAIGVRKRLRALKGEALGVFRHQDIPTGKGEILLRADIFDLLTDEEKQALREQAQAWGDAHGQTEKEKARMAEERYNHLLDQAYEAAKTRPPPAAMSTLAHEIGHAIDWLSEKMIQGRGNIFGHIAALKNYLKGVVPLDPDFPAGEAITSKGRAKMRRQAEKQLRDEMGPIKDVVQTILVEEPELRITGITPADVRAMFGMDARETMPELYKWFAEQTADVKKEIVRKAMKGVLDERLAAMGKAEVIGKRMVEKTIHQKVGREPTPEEITARFQQIFRDELKMRNLAELKTVRAEAERAIAWWNGTSKMPEYYSTPEEMYAEMFSIFLNNPAALAKRAPTYTRLLWNYMEARPEVAKTYDTIQNQIRAGTAKDVSKTERLASWDRADAESLERLKHDTKLLRGESFLENLAYHYDRRFGLIYSTARGIPTEGRVREAIGNFIYRAANHELVLNLVNRKVSRPLVQAGMEWKDLGDYMFLNRVIHERFNIANPGAVYAGRAMEELQAMKDTLGPRRFAILEKSAQTLREIYADKYLARARAEGMWSPELQKYIDDNIHYATFDVVPEPGGNDGIERLINSRFGNQGGFIYRQIGTLKEIRNPATATVMKMLSLMSSLDRNIAKRETVEMLNSLPNAREMIMPARKRPAQSRDGKTYMESIPYEDSRVSTITYLQNGEPQMFYVPRLYADALNKGNEIKNRLALRMVKLNAGLKGLFTQLNYGFWPVNVVRDSFGWMMQMPGFFTPLHWGDEFPAALKDAYASLKGRPAPYTERALDRRMLISRADPGANWTGAEDRLEVELARYGLEPARWENVDGEVSRFVKLWNGYRELGQVVERANKIAAMNYLDRPAFDKMPEWKKAEIVRERGGSPDFLQRGASNPFVDFLALFYNPWKEAIRSVSRAARDNPWSFAGKTTAFVMMPTMVQVLAQAGAFGDELRKKYKSIPWYDLSNYLVIPMWWDKPETKDVAYLRLPLWEPARILHQLLWHTFTGHDQGVLDAWGGTLPGGNPLYRAVYDIAQYELFGHNAFDTFRGKDVLSDTLMKAGGDTFWKRVTGPATKELLKYEWNSLGGPVVYRFKNQYLDDPPSTPMQQFLDLPGVSNLIGRWVKVSHRGLDDAARKSIADDEEFRGQTALGVQEIERKLMNNEALTNDEKRLMREPYAMQYFMRTFKGHLMSRESQLYKATKGKPPEEKLKILQSMSGQ